MASLKQNKEVVIIKYNAGNIQSVWYALERIGINAVISDDHDRIRDADKVIFPGVGEASSAMQYLRERELDKLIRQLKQPTLGICLGMQLLCAFTAENDTECIGIFDEQVRLFKPSGGREKVPQIGWNTLSDLKTPLFQGINNGSYVYSVHSYYAALGKHTIAESNYIHAYSAALWKDNFYGVQFHPEKSAETGERLLKNFIFTIK